MQYPMLQLLCVDGEGMCEGEVVWAHILQKVQGRVLAELWRMQEEWSSGG